MIIKWSWKKKQTKKHPCLLPPPKSAMCSKRLSYYEVIGAQWMVHDGSGKLENARFEFTQVVSGLDFSHQNVLYISGRFIKEIVV